MSADENDETAKNGSRQGVGACKYNELEWKVARGVVFALAGLLVCWSACIYERKKLAPHLHRQSSAVFAFPGWEELWEKGFFAG